MLRCALPALCLTARASRPPFRLLWATTSPAPPPTGLCAIAGAACGAPGAGEHLFNAVQCWLAWAREAGASQACMVCRQLAWVAAHPLSWVATHPLPGCLPSCSPPHLTAPLPCAATLLWRQLPTQWEPARCTPASSRSAVQTDAVGGLSCRWNHRAGCDVTPAKAQRSTVVKVPPHHLPPCATSPAAAAGYCRQGVVSPQTCNAARRLVLWPEACATSAQ